MNNFDSLKVGNYCLLSVITLSVLTPMKLSYTWYYSIFYKGGGLIEMGGLINFLVQKGGLLERMFTVLTFTKRTVNFKLASVESASITP